jgi:flagellar FliL protein
VSAAAAEAAPPKKPKSKKKLLVILLVVVLVLVLGGGGALFFLKKKAAAAAAEDGDGEATAEVAEEDHDKHPPTFMPIDNLVVNLADTGGDRFAQIGITFELADSHAADRLKNYLPNVRSAILMLASQRTAEELLKREGKEKLAEDILGEASKPFGFGPDTDAKRNKKKAKDGPAGENPVKRVLFSSFIIQ